MGRPVVSWTRVRAFDPAAARIASAERIEVDEPCVHLGEPAAARGAGDRGALAVADGDRAQLGIGRMDHV